MSKFGGIVRRPIGILGDILVSTTGGNLHRSVDDGHAIGESSASSSSPTWRVKATVLNTNTVFLEPIGPPLTHSDDDDGFNDKPISWSNFLLKIKKTNDF